MLLGLRGAPEQGGGSVATEAVAVMRTFMVVEVQKRVETPLQCGSTGEVASAEGHTPVLLQDRALQPLDEAIGPGMPGFLGRVGKPQLAPGPVEGAMEFGPPIGQNATQPPARAPIVRHEDRPQEMGRGLGRVGRQQPGHRVGVVGTPIMLRYGMCKVLTPPARGGSEMSREIESEAGTIGPEVTPSQEVPMVRQEQWEEIRRLAFRERVPIAEIARRLDLNRRTVRRCLRAPTWTPYRRPPRTDTVLAAHLTYLRARA